MSETLPAGPPLLHDPAPVFHARTTMGERSLADYRGRWLLLFSHLAWVRCIREHFGVAVPFPIIEDPSMAIARAYGMISPRAPDAAMVRAAFVIDPAGIILAITWYPMTTGRNVAELLRLVAALQITVAHAVSTPEGWRPGDEVILPPALTVEEAERRAGEPTDWFYRTGAAPDAPRLLPDARCG